MEKDGNGLFPVSLQPNLKVMSMGFLMENAESAVIWRGPMKHSLIRQFLRDVNWGPLDFLVVDSPPGTGDEPLSVIQLVGQPASAIVVTTPQDVAVADVRRSITFCRKLGLPVAGVIENMSGFVCPHCGKTTDLFKSGGGEALAREMNAPFLGRVPRTRRWCNPATEANPSWARRIRVRLRKPSAPSLPPSKAQCISRRKRKKDHEPFTA